MDRLLVTGGLGFIGSNFIRQRFSRILDSHIINLDSMSYGSNLLNLAEFEGDQRYHFEKCDVRDTEKVSSLVRQADVVVHFAAETHVDRSIASPTAFLESNVIGTHSLLDAARKANVKKFVQISTDEVYGSASGNQSFDENSKLNPSSPYSASKAAADLFAFSYHRTYGLPVSILRCTNNFGPYQFPEKFIPKSIIRALLGKQIPVYGDGSQVRDWIYVEDFCEAISRVIERGSPGNVYNVSAGNELANIEIVKRVLGLLKKSADLIQFVEDRPGHDFRYSLDSHVIRENLGWTPHLTLDDALKRTVTWYLSNRNWWEPLLNEKTLSPTPWKENW
jgi:dTDP-glucose 4,6-dehydratase